MTDYTDHMTLLIIFLLVALPVFVLAYTFRLDRFGVSTLISTIIIAGVIVILARFGGGPIEPSR